LKANVSPGVMRTVVCIAPASLSTTVKLHVNLLHLTQPKPETTNDGEGHSQSRSPHLALKT
jgi:hypothetical protein